MTCAPVTTTQTDKCRSIAVPIAASGMSATGAEMTIDDPEETADLAVSVVRIRLWLAVANVAVGLLAAWWCSTWQVGAPNVVLGLLFLAAAGVAWRRNA